MYKKILLLILINTFGFCYAQNLKEFMRYNYEVTYLKRLDNQNPETATCILDVYPNRSFFADKNFIEKQYALSNINPDQDRFTQVSNINSKYRPIAFNFLVYKTNSSTTLYNQISETKVQYLLDNHFINWVVSPEISDWNNFKVQKATATINGREWTVLFTKEIAINNGPYIFNTLPGFVVKAWDSQSQYIFEFLNSEKLNIDYNYLIESSNYKSITIKQKNQLLSNYYNKTYRAFWSETQSNVEQFASLFPLDKKIGEVENPIDLSFKK